MWGLYMLNKYTKIEKYNTQFCQEHKDLNMYSLYLGILSTLMISSNIELNMTWVPSANIWFWQKIWYATKSYDHAIFKIQFKIWMHNVVLRTNEALSILFKCVVHEFEE